MTSPLAKAVSYVKGLFGIATTSTTETPSPTPSSPSSSSSRSSPSFDGSTVTDAEAELLNEASAVARELDEEDVVDISPSNGSVNGNSNGLSDESSNKFTLSTPTAAPDAAKTTTNAISASHHATEDGQSFREAVVAAALYPLFVAHIRQTFPDLLTREARLRAKCDMRSPEEW